MKKIGIVGSGLSALTLAYNLIKKGKENLLIIVFEKENNPGGRCRTFIHEDLHFDLGANIIDFSNEHMKSKYEMLLPSMCHSKMKKLEKKFLIFENEQIAEGDKINDKYYYENGFNNLVSDIIHSIRKESEKNQCIFSLRLEEEVLSMNLIDNDIFVKSIKRKEVFEHQFDRLILACPTPSIGRIIDKSTRILKLSQFCQKVEYTSQISVGFRTKHIEHDFSCILFKKHEILIFACSSQEKYHEDTIVFQTTEKFTENCIGKNLSESEIKHKVYNALPMFLKEIIVFETGIVKYWPISLIKPSNHSTSEKLEKQEEGEDNVFEQEKVSIIGDAVMGKSRISNAVLSAEIVLKKLNLLHL